MFVLSLLALFGCRQQSKTITTETGIVDSIADVDADGYSAAEDCDDNDADINPGAEEICDGIDNNCDGEIDEEVLLVFYADSDGDGFGNPDISTEACENTDGFVQNGSDCDDGNDTVYPSAEELCDELDNDCNDLIDDGLGEIYLVDADGDGFGDDDNPIEACDLRDGLSAIGGDCNDQDATISPVGIELCDEVDNNCDGQVDEGVTITFYADADEDGYGDDATTVESCSLPESYVTQGGDCDDIDTLVYPGAPEICDAQDNNCDGVIDEDDAVDAPLWYADTDEDNYGDTNSTITSCSQPTGYVADNTDCNDNNDLISPAMAESCDGLDNNCDGVIDEDGAIGGLTYYLDSDMDNYGHVGVSVISCSQPNGYVLDGSDCDDNDNDIYPGAVEYCNTEDDNCDGTIDEDSAVDASLWYADVDTDGYGDPSISVAACSQPPGYTEDNMDCNDDDININPDAVEYCNSVDDNCDGTIDEDTAVDALIWYGDFDEDGYGDLAEVKSACVVPSGYVDDNTDCDDNDDDTYPGAVEYCNLEDDDCDGDVDEDSEGSPSWYADLDSDGYGDDSNMLQSCQQPLGYVSDNSDCNDTDNEVNPLAVEYCNSVDDNCDGTIDEDTAVDVLTWYEDFDVDGFGDPNVFVDSCDAPLGYTADDTDCDDTNDTIFYGATEVCGDGLDNDCDGDVDEDITGTEECPATSCKELYDLGYTTDGLYWLDSDGDLDVSDAWQAFCDMTRDGGGWTKVESAQYPHFFSDPGWEEYGLADEANYTQLTMLDDFATNGVYTFRFEVGNSGSWNGGSRSHFTIWSQQHNPTNSSTNGSGYTYISGEESTTCGGFNGLHYEYYVQSGLHTVISDVDNTDNAGCWWMQVVPLVDYNCCGGYLEGYGGASNGHSWQALYIR